MACRTRVANQKRTLKTQNHPPSSLKTQNRPLSSVTGRICRFTTGTITVLKNSGDSTALGAAGSEKTVLLLYCDGLVLLSRGMEADYVRQRNHKVFGTVFEGFGELC